MRLPLHDQWPPGPPINDLGRGANAKSELPGTRDLPQKGADLFLAGIWGGIVALIEVAAPRLPHCHNAKVSQRQRQAYSTQRIAALR